MSRAFIVNWVLLYYWINILLLLDLLSLGPSCVDPGFEYKICLISIFYADISD